MENNQYNYRQLVKVEVNNDNSSDTEVEETYNYDIDGNVKDKGIRIVDYNNIEKTISYEYDILGNVTRVSYMPIDLDLENETITGEAYYEAADEISAGNNFIVNSGGSLTLKAGTAIKFLSGFSVNLGGTLTTLFGGEGSAGPEETQVTYAYDVMGRIEKIGTTADEDFFASYNYDVNGAMHQEKLHNNAVTRTYTYENPGWLKEIDDSFIKETLTYTSGAYGSPSGYYNGNIAKAVYDLKWSGNPGDYNVQYKYDKHNRLLVANNSLSGKDVGVANEISYDANGNLKDLTRNGVAKNYNYYSGTNKVQNIDGSGNDYVHDANGNIVTSVNKSLSNITYDPFINLATNIMATDLTYGASSQRTLKNDTYGSIAYIHGLSDFPLMEKVNDGSSEVTKLYVYGPTGLLAVNDDEGWFFMLKDHLGSTRVVLNESNNRVSNYDYMPFGNIMRSSVNTDVSYQFTGQEYDTQLSLHNFRARMYDSDLGMFYAVDPAGQGFSSFGYANNNPIIYTDPDGKNPLLIFAGLVVGGGLLNAVFNADAIHSTGDFFNFFGLGAATTAMGIVSGGSGVGIVTSANLLYAGNTIFRREYLSQEGFLMTTAFAVATYGISNLLQGQSFFNNFMGKPTVPVVGNIKPTGSINNPGVNGKPGQMPKSNIKGLLDDFDDILPEGQIKLKIVPKSEIPSMAIHKHHIFPQSKEFSQYFTRVGIDIDKFTVQLPSTVHLSKPIHGFQGGLWNQTWKKFFSAYPNATRNEIMSFARTMMGKWGISNAPIVPFR